MIQSIAGICEKSGVALTETIYENCAPEMLNFKIVSGDYYDFNTMNNGKKLLRYKSCVDIFDYQMLKKQLPQLEAVNFPKRDSFPYFSAGLSSMKERLEQGERVAVEGGPCLFGTNEVMIEVTRNSGKKDYFDYNTGKAYLDDESEENSDDFAGFVKANARQIKSVSFENRKTGITPQEWAFVKYPFEIAEAIDGPLVIPIPDMSYLKYLTAVLESVDKQVSEKAIREFSQIEAKITKLYLELIGQMGEQYKSVFYKVVHAGEKELCDKFYKSRLAYMNRRKILRNLTGFSEKLESVKDYVSMPALPYYLFGINNVIEVDSMDETDSFRKCRKAHKGVLNLACILFPELLSTDNIHTIFDAPYERKEYGRYEMLR